MRFADGNDILRGFLLVLAVSLNTSSNALEPSDVSVSGVNDLVISWNRKCLYIYSGELLYRIKLGDFSREPMRLQLGPNNSPAFVILKTQETASARSLSISHIAEPYPNVLEVCAGDSSTRRCLLYNTTKEPYTKLTEMQNVYHLRTESVLVHFAGGQLLMIYLSKSGNAPLLQIRAALPTLRIGTDEKANEYRKQYVTWWKRMLETNNHNGMQFADSPATGFHGAFASPGRRYLVFTEPAMEAGGGDYSKAFTEAKPIYTRIARVCTDDPGLRMPGDGRLVFTSFFKTRLICQVLNGRAKADPNKDYHSLYDQIRGSVKFDHVVTMAQAWTTSSSAPASMLYGLFSTSDPALAMGTSDHLLRSLHSLTPLALCVYRLDEVDKVIHSSDLLRLVPLPRSSVKRPNLYDLNHSNFTNSQPHISGPVHLFQRVQRKNVKGLENVTKCPGPSPSNRRLALEAPLLTDYAYPLGGEATGLIQSHAGVSAMVVDPRYVQHPINKYTNRSQEAGKIGSLKFTILYLGTEFGSPDTCGLNKQFMRTAGRLFVIGQLQTVNQSHPIKAILFIQTSRSNVTEAIPFDSKVSLDMKGLFELAVVSSQELMRVPVQRCLMATTCSECVGLRDPDCYWNEKTRRCGTDSNGVNDIVWGTHSQCTSVERLIAAESASSLLNTLTGFEIRRFNFSKSEHPLQQPARSKADSSDSASFPGFLGNWRLGCAAMIGLVIGVASTWLAFAFRQMRARRRIPMIRCDTSTLNQPLNCTKGATQSFYVPYNIPKPNVLSPSFNYHNVQSPKLGACSLPVLIKQCDREYLRQPEMNPTHSTKLGTFCLNNDFISVKSNIYNPVHRVTEEVITDDM
ncbi:unnamed protein product [Calicophoron daubneyi]|uniref:Sema domain-containing protein n=1 Tax=Calicophoron daubneyi TaxID=300641 RepID=A0AAV2T8N7_CALDB